MISYADYLSWKESEVTRTFFQILRDKILYHNDRLISSELTDLGRVGREVGAIHTLRDILEIDYKDVVNDESR